ncbi:hypothetical protein KK488_12530 [Sphingobium sp. H33]|uniref:S-adenosyl-L-homocysteine hydrolase n=2 Tax=Sphingobium nicotianae TaxID=2782607 RepID=A0A9X1DCT6_9SPHN|nr:hypothetical protein [Sphingobium nicotianae]
MKIRGVLAAAAVTMSLAGMSSQAIAATCWAQNAVEAAQVRGFETMLMVATLRCQIKGVDLSGDYNAFVRSKRAVLTGVNDELRAKFVGQGLKGNAALDAYDRFVTSIANSYGSGIGAPSCGEFKTILDGANAAPASRSALLALALEVGSDPVRQSDRCAGARIALAN